MAEIAIRIEGRAGRVTLQRPDALNALTAEMIPAISEALTAWASDPGVASVILDAEGERAFCAGGDIADLYAAGRAGDLDFGRRFWANEYALNAQIAEFPKPIFSFLQGFTMGGGVGLGCHASCRIVGESSRIAMPECGIGLVPDVGGSLILAQAPGRLGEYLGLTGARMGPGDAVHAGFADLYLEEAHWGVAKREIIAGAVALDGQGEPPHRLATEEIDQVFAGETLADILTALDASTSDLAETARAAMLRNSPLALQCALILIRRVRRSPTIRGALREEYRFTARATRDGDFLEGIRAAIIDKDRRPVWKHGPTRVTVAEAEAMLAPLPEGDWTGPLS